MTVRCPPIPDALIDYLEAIFPDRAVDPAQTNPHQAYGQQEVIRHLRHQYTQQEEVRYVST